MAAVAEELVIKIKVPVRKEGSNVTSNEQGVDFFKAFPENYPDRFSELKKACNVLTVGIDEDGQIPIGSRKFGLLPLKLIHCNASCNVAFKFAFCSIEQYEDVSVLFHGLFYEGFKVLVDYLRENKVPQDGTQQMALRKLLTFFVMDYDALVQSYEVKCRRESEICLFLMNHLISKLSVHEQWKMDCGSNGKETLECPCKTTDCPVMVAKDIFADLSMGNLEVWHGTVDAMTLSLVDIVPLQIPCVVLEEDAGNTEDDEEVERYQSESNLDGNRSQLFAKTIVNSFLHKSFDSRVSFVPVLGIKRNSVQIVMYDVDLDVLLSTVELEFSNPKSGALDPEMSYATFLVIWLVCNFEVFLSTLDGNEVDRLKSKCANFATFAKDKLEIYKKGLRFQDVRRKAVEQELVPARTGEIFAFKPGLKIEIKRPRLN